MYFLYYVTMYNIRFETFVFRTFKMGEKRDKEIKRVQLAFFMFTMTPFCFCDVIKRRCLMLSNNAIAILNYVIALNMT